jgi:hypothetical protein
MHPGGDSGRGDLKTISGLGSRPTPGGTKLKNRQPQNRMIVGTPVRRYLLNAAILDALFLGQQSDFLPESIILLFEPDSGVPTVGSPASGEC